MTKDITISDSNWSGFPTFSGELDGNNQTVTIEGGSQRLFQEIAADGKVENLNINVAGSISASSSDGISYAGGVAGLNNYNGSVSDCTVTVNGSVNGSASNSIYAGGVAGKNFSAGITGCTVTIADGGSISASTNESNALVHVGGVVGDNSNNSSVGGCKVTVNGSISAGDSSFSYAGSVVGYNTNNGIVDDNNEVEDNNDLKLPEIGNQPNQS